MKRVTPSNGASNARPETMLFLQQRLALICQLERKLLRRRSVVLELGGAEVISTRVGCSSAFRDDAASRNPE